MAEERTYRVGELAALVGLTVRTLHHYDAIGLVRPSSRTSGGHRLYRDGDLGRLYAVLALRRMAMPTAEIAAELARPGWRLSDLVRRQQLALESERSALDALRRKVDALLERADLEDPLDLIEAMRDLAPAPGAVRRVLALLPYHDLLEAQARLVDMFGFAAGHVDRDPTGAVVHAVVLADSGFVHLHPPTDDVRPPDGGPASAIVVAAVTGIDAHAERAVAAGATLTYGPADMTYGVREYGARDHAGHHWSFQEPIRLTSGSTREGDST